METLLIQTDETKAKGIKQLLKAFGVVYKVEKTKQKEKPYNPEFVKMVLEVKDQKEFIPLTEEYKRNLFRGL